ncbi:MAG TPA: hypothetical protein RMG45_11575, partial [Polyangiaceae bacterium LLY-WYZ-15_(1-7)]|nr:hypothetical protein [Polyangiaceae bacterium LLY-WYZ-15_(1-7)]
GDRTCQWFAPACLERGLEGSNATCSDGEDNDLDGLTDCDDPDCVGREGIVVCDDEGMAVEFADDDAITAAADEECSNGTNEDPDRGDFTDCGDFGCSRDSLVTTCNDSAEGNAETCADEMDNDGNSFTDCDDFACAQNPDPAICPDVEKSEAACSDGVDNDGNGFVDCNDFSCDRAIVCRQQEPEE